MNKFILFFSICLSVLIRTIIVTHSLDVADMKPLYEMGNALLKGLNPYVALQYNIYPPIALYIEAVSIQLSLILNIPFHIITRLLPNLADIIITLIIYKFLLRLKTKPIAAALWSATYILNPVSILVSATHGQIDSIPTLLIIVTIYLLTFSTLRTASALAAISLGLAIAIKPNPAMLIPFFLFFRQTSFKEKFYFLILSAAPTILTLAPFLFPDFQQVIGKVFSYSGVYDFGYSAILRGFWYQQNASIWLAESLDLLSASKVIFLLASLILFILFAGYKNLSKMSLCIYLLFLGIYFGISAQYLSWILPLAIIEKDKFIIPYSFFASVAIVGFYLFFGPDILTGNFLHIQSFQAEYMLVYFIGNLAFWLLTLWWLIKILNAYIHTTLKTLSPLRKRIIFTLSLVLVVNLFPLVSLVIKVVQKSVE